MKSLCQRRARKEKPLSATEALHSLQPHKDRPYAKMRSCDASASLIRMQLTESKRSHIAIDAYSHGMEQFPLRQLADRLEDYADLSKAIFGN
jgi:hypothetical protein